MSIRRKLFGNIPDDAVTVEDISDAKPMKRIVGKIIHIEEEKGWGFITSHELKFTRVYFHWTALNQDTLHFTELKKGMMVEFEPKEHEPRKWRAIKINVVNTEVEDTEDESD